MPEVLWNDPWKWVCSVEVREQGVLVLGMGQVRVRVMRVTPIAYLRGLY
jgi:hypothetical protein